MENQSQSYGNNIEDTPNDDLSTFETPYLFDVVSICLQAIANGIVRRLQMVARTC
jgi:hypothetical protein